MKCLNICSAVNVQIVLILFSIYFNGKLIIIIIIIEWNLTVIIEDRMWIDKSTKELLNLKELALGC